MRDKNHIWGIGLGRTGTKSLVNALGSLGYSATHNAPYIKDILHSSIDCSAEGVVLRNYKYLDVKFPDSQFILTTRNLRAWLASCKKAMEALYPIDGVSKGSEFYNVMLLNRVARYGCVEYDENKLLEKYYHHHYDVISHFKGHLDKLLIMDITNGDGWQTLCPFLELESPSIAFPKVGP